MQLSNSQEQDHDLQISLVQLSSYVRPAMQPGEGIRCFHNAT